ncbi:MAG: NAD(P)-dependent oxidoreductase [Acutalibacteraceae bacterium]
MKLLVTGAVNWSKNHLNIFEQAGHEVVFACDEKVSLEMQNIDPSQFEGVICNGLFLYNDIKRFTRLRFIQLTSAGYDRVPLEYINDRKIKIFNARDVYSVPMAEFAVCGVLSLYKQMRFFMDNQKIHRWEKKRNLLELSGKTVCIIGCGSVGRACAVRFEAFGCYVVGVSRTKKSYIGFDKVEDLAALPYILPESDIVVLAVPLTDETYHMFSFEQFEKMKCNSLLVNISRGAVVNTEALLNAIESGKLLGAVLDVFEEEPLEQSSRLWDFDNVIITPHNFFVGERNEDRMFDVVIKNLYGFSD